MFTASLIQSFLFLLLIRKDSQYEGEQQEWIGDDDFMQAFFQDS